MMEDIVKQIMGGVKGKGKEEAFGKAPINPMMGSPGFGSIDTLMGPPPLEQGSGFNIGDIIKLIAGMGG